MVDQLIAHIRKFSTVEEADLILLESLIRRKTYQKKELVLPAGHRCHYQHFIVSGCMRSFFINNKGVEQIVNFGIENWWMTDYDSFVNERASALNIQALEECEVLSINKLGFDELIRKSSGLANYFRIILEKRHIADQRRIQYMFNLTGEEIYDTFFNLNPEFIQRVPQYMLASYLGFTPEFLSKIRKKKSQGLS
ncbi:MAG: Crp/Fnr family transcriptional regulator [Reichenbachiella sp.]|uniref:Crp/Fnr family transcriptional regulator n=1 Tax=Reichenbachiella sp. TaxID=2184521 RepID=UPI003267C4F1